MVLHTMVFCPTKDYFIREKRKIDVNTFFGLFSLIISTMPCSLLLAASASVV